MEHNLKTGQEKRNWVALPTMTMKKFESERLVYDGADASDYWKVTSIGHSKLNVANLDTVTIGSIHEYESGCKIHENCLGHMVRTPNGVLLPIQSLCVHNINVANVVFKAADVALREQNSYGARCCGTILRDSMKKKTGRMRKGILNCHIDGSLRMVVTPQWCFSRNTIAIPWYLRDKWVVCRLDNATNKYKSDTVKDGDYAVVVRPPSLSAQSVQPMIVRYWDRTCLGISPDIISAFHGDYDGDEMHVNPVYSEKALQECRMWISTPNFSIERANKLYAELGLSTSLSHKGSYMSHTTMSFHQIMCGLPQLLLAEDTRLKAAHIDIIKRRICSRSEFHRIFDSESIRGMADINRRYLTQPVVGDMSRIAKIVASCVSQDSGGWIGIWTTSGFRRLLHAETDPHAGNAAVRGISTICSSAQQVALDAHRVSQEMSSLHDMISDLIVGSEYTLVALSPEHILQHDVVDRKWVRWKYSTRDACYLVCKPSWYRLLNSNDIVAAYNPTVLSRVKPENRLDVCLRGVSMICTYYSIALSVHELKSLSVLYTYMPEAHTLPITTRDGMHSRTLQWTETTMARHYVGLVDSVNRSEIQHCPATTVSACLLCANFETVE